MGRSCQDDGAVCVVVMIVMAVMLVWPGQGMQVGSGYD